MTNYVLVFIYQPYVVMFRIVDSGLRARQIHKGLKLSPWKIIFLCLLDLKLLFFIIYLKYCIPGRHQVSKYSDDLRINFVNIFNECETKSYAFYNCKGGIYVSLFSQLVLKLPNILLLFFTSLRISRTFFFAHNISFFIVAILCMILVYILQDCLRFIKKLVKIKSWPVHEKKMSGRFLDKLSNYFFRYLVLRLLYCLFVIHSVFYFRYP